MHPEIEKLIKFAIADGLITEKERAVILKKAESLGEDKDEVELILNGELALAKKQQEIKSESKEKSSYKVGEIKKCPSCGSQVSALQLKCADCDYEFSSETDSNKQIRDYIQELQLKLREVEDSMSTNQKALFGEKQILNKKVTIINTFTLPTTKESLIHLLIFSYTNYESIQENAITLNPLKKAWLAKSLQAFNLLKTQKSKDGEIAKIVDEYSFLDLKHKSQDNRQKQIVDDLKSKKGKTTKKFAIGCGVIILLFLLMQVIGPLLFFGTGMFDKILENSDINETPAKYENVVDSLLSLGQVEEAIKEANRIKSNNDKKDANDLIKIYMYKRLLEENKVTEAKDKANTISSDYKRKEALDDILEYEINRLIESGDITSANAKVNVINSDYKRKEIKDKILVIEIDKMIEEQRFDDALAKAKQIDNSYTREDAIEKVKNAKN